MDTMTAAERAQRFGAWLTAAALAAGYDVTPGGGGRTALAEACGLSPSAMGRALDGKTLPRPTQYELIAKAVKREVNEVFVEGGILSPEYSTTGGEVAVRSQPTTLEQQLEYWGVTNPVARTMLVANIEQAIKLSSQDDSGPEATATG
jgi:hypothetical protein